MADILTDVVTMGASDLHLAVNVPPMVRLDGELRNLDYPMLDSSKARELIYSILTQDQRQKLETEWEVDLSYSLYGKARFRVNAYFDRGSLAAALRVVPVNIKTVEQLGLPPVHPLLLSKTPRLRPCHRSHRLREVDHPGRHSGRSQPGPVGSHRHHRGPHRVPSRAQALHGQPAGGGDRHQGLSGRASLGLRQDPDVILIGEMRDLETIQIALTAAETGHLVFATLHTQDAPQTIDRMIDVFPPHQQSQIRVQIAATLEGVVTQQLLPKVTGEGRVAAVEILLANPAVRNLIREGKTHQLYTVMQTGGQQGMQTMNASLAHLVRKGDITKELAMRRSSTPDDLTRLLAAANCLLGAAPAEWGRRRA